MGEIIVITSGKGGVGKTTTVANLGYGLADLGKRVLLVDTDIGLRNLDVILGLENQVNYNLVDVILGNCRFHQAAIKDKRNHNLFLLPCSQKNDKESIEPMQIVKLLDELKDEFDFIILDCPAGIEHGFKNATIAARSAIVVTTPEIASIRDAYRVIELLGDKPKRLLINRIRDDLIRRGSMLSTEDVKDILEIELLGVIPEDEAVVIASSIGETLIGTGTSVGNSYERICRRMLGEQVPIHQVKEGVLGKISRLFARQV